VQQNGNPGKPDENRDKALHFARKALDQSADIDLFYKELTLGYTPDFRSLTEQVSGSSGALFDGQVQLVKTGADQAKQHAYT